MTIAKRRRPDRITAPDIFADKEATAVSYALLPFDQASRAAERKWGIDRLPSLVAPELAARWGAFMSRLNEAITANDVERIKRGVPLGIQGLAEMDADATARGAQPASPDVLEYDLDGFHFAILPDERMWPAVRDARPDLRLFTLREVGLALQAVSSGGLVDAVKAQFPGAEIRSITKRVSEPTPDDELPF